MLPRNIYVHVPFCARRCSYCDFPIAVRRNVPAREYLAALAREVATWRRDLCGAAPPGGWGPTAPEWGPTAPEWDPTAAEWDPSAPVPVETLYLGGGTPSRLGGQGVAELLRLLRVHLATEPAGEVTLEANPDDITAAATRMWREAGVNRLSIGAQSFHPPALAWMHRTHSAEQISEAVAVARDAAIENISLDLIFALPSALRRDWRADVEHALALRPQHISLYGLTVEPRTPLARWVDRGVAVEAPEEQFERDFLLAHDILTGAGYEHYEVSNYARPGYTSHHNSSYWRRTPYAGFGPGAHSFDGEVRRWNVPDYAEWVTRMERGEPAEAGREFLRAESRQEEEAYLGLRTREGVPVSAADDAELARWVRAGWATLGGGRVQLTAPGWLRLDALAGRLNITPSH